MNSRCHNRTPKSRSRSNSMAPAAQNNPSSNNNDLNCISSDDGSNAFCETLIRTRDKCGRTLLHCLTSSSFPSSPHSMKNKMESKAKKSVHSNTRHFDQTQKLVQMDWLLTQILHSYDDNHSNKKINQQQQILRHCLACPDLESGYTPLHRAIYARDLRMILLLLYYASDSNLIERQQVKGQIELTHLNYMNLLESGGLLGGNSNRKETSPNTSLMYHLTQQCKDNEGHTPLELLGQLTIDSNRVLLSRIRQQSIPYIEQYHSKNRSRSDSIASMSCISNSNNAIDEDDTDSFFDSNDDAQQPHGDIFSFSQLPQSVQRYENEDSLYKKQSILMASELTYGTEVLTFGSQDHPALGQFRSSSKLTDKMGSSARIGSSQQSRGAGVIMGRIETFATFNRDNKTEENDDTQKYETGKFIMNNGRNKDQDIGNAVDISVASHHSLVVTTSGFVFSCGLGKGGKLGLGSEQTVLKPQRIEGLLSNRFVTTVAAAENHSLCTTLEGDVFAWGSNRFGQLGIAMSNCNNHNNSRTAVGGSSSSSTIFLFPTRVDDLRKHHITNLAAGDRHSVALSKEGEVFCFGDNKFGQCGSQSSTSVNQYHRVRKVDSLWSSNPRKIVIAVAASDKSTLVLTKSLKKYGQFTNAVYSWGNGAHSPTKVNFSSSSAQSNSQSRNAKKKRQPFHVSKNVSSADLINPIKIACAKNHNVAISADGKVYTWGLSSDAMARDDSKTRDLSTNRSDSSFKWNSPQLVKGMLPENGGGKVIAVSASEHHTAVVTSAGHLYTWGAANYGDKTLGHDGVKYQPCPRRVPGVFRAVRVSTAREHTALLLGVSFPHFPKPFKDAKEKIDFSSIVPSLHLSCQKATATYVDIFNVIPILLVAERQYSTELIEYCLQFIHHNLDTVLSVAKKRHLESLLREGLTYLDRNFIQEDIDFNCSILFNSAKKSPTIGNTEAIESKLRSLTVCRHTSKIDVGVPVVKVCGKKNTLTNKDAKDCVVKAHPSLRAVKLAHEKCDLSNLSALSVRYDLLNKSLRSIRKKLNIIATLENQIDDKNCGTNISTESADDSFSLEQLEKLARRPILEADLALLQPYFDEVQSKMKFSNVLKENKTKFLSINTGAMVGNSIVLEAKDHKEKPESEKSIDSGRKIRCDICNVTCPDEKSLSLHLNGRRHRNRERHLEEVEEKETARKLMQHKELCKCKEKKSGVNKSTLRDFNNQNNSLYLPKFDLSPPSNISKEEDCTWQSKKKIDWAKSIPRKSIPSPVQKMTSKPKASKFQEIMEEEERQKMINAKKNDCSNTLKKISLHNSSSYGVLSNSNAMMSPPVSCLSSPSNIGTVSLSLGSLLNISEKKKAPKSTVEKISPSPKKLAWNVATPTTPLNSLRSGRNICNPSARIQQNNNATGECGSKSFRKISFFEIQQNEEELKAKAETQTGVDINGRWFVHRRDRAASIENIQRLEEENRQKELFIKEQKEIEDMIMRENKKLKEQKRALNKKKGVKENRRRKEQKEKKRQIADNYKKDANPTSDEVSKESKVDVRGKHQGKKKSVPKVKIKLNASAGEFKPVRSSESSHGIKSEESPAK